MVKHYAMILLNKIIDVVDSDNEPVYPPDPWGNPVVAVECDPSITINDIFYPETGTFEHIDIIVDTSTQLDKIEEQVYSNNENNIILMEAMADQYEQTEQYRINDMEVQATIFETVLALSEGGTTV